MSSNFGVNVSATAEASRPLAIESSTPIAFVGSASGIDPSIHRFSSPKKAVDFLKEKKSHGSIVENLPVLEAQNLTSPIILSIFSASESTEEATKIADDTASAVQALENLKQSPGDSSKKANLIVCPEYSHIDAISAKMIETADYLSAHAIIDLKGDTEAELEIDAAKFSAKRALLCAPKVKFFDATSAQTKELPFSPAIAGQIARTDGQREYGWADSHSNRIILGITGFAQNYAYIPGKDSPADRLRAKGICLGINYKGLRSWGNDTTDEDPIWKDLTRIRIFDRILEAALDGLFWAVDRNAMQTLPFVKESVEGLLRALKASSALLGFEVTWDKEKNTKENITAGKFYLKATLQNTPLVKRLEVSFSYQDRWGQVLFRE